jgi:hypothetical protein
MYDQLIINGFERIERDDRMLDVFTNETREKGIELWEKWTDNKVEIIRLHLPKGENGMSRYIFQRKEIETALEENKELRL